MTTIDISNKLNVGLIANKENNPCLHYVIRELDLHLSQCSEDNVPTGCRLGQKAFTIKPLNGLLNDDI